MAINFITIIRGKRGVLNDGEEQWRAPTDGSNMCW